MLRQRVLSALILAPIALGAIIAGRPFIEVLVLIAASISAWEWVRLCGAERLRWTLVVMVGGIVAVVLSGVADGAVMTAGIAIATLGLAWLAARLQGAESPGWCAAGFLVVMPATFALVWLRDQPAAGPLDGLALTLWLIGAVWATDIGAYFIGRAVGGPRLAPAISPGKTWSGLVGGMVSAALWSAGFAWWLGATAPYLALAVGSLAAILAQAGDLAISHAKRRFHVKDSSALIPGHGGVLDRIDGLLSLTPVVALVFWLARGRISEWW